MFVYTLQLQRLPFLSYLIISFGYYRFHSSLRPGLTGEVFPFWHILSSDPFRFNFYKKHKLQYCCLATQVIGLALYVNSLALAFYIKSLALALQVKFLLTSLSGSGISVFSQNFTEFCVNTEIPRQRPNSVRLYCCCNCDTQSLRTATQAC